MRKCSALVPAAEDDEEDEAPPAAAPPLSTRIFPNAECTPASLDPSATSCSRNGVSSLSLLRCSTSSHSASTGTSDRTERMRLVTNSSGASASRRPPTTAGAAEGLTFWT